MLLLIGAYDELCEILPTWWKRIAASNLIPLFHLKSPKKDLKSSQLTIMESLLCSGMWNHAERKIAAKFVILNNKTKNGSLAQQWKFLTDFL